MDGFLDDDAAEDILFFGGEADVGQRLSVFEGGFATELVEDLLLDIGTAEKQEVDIAVGFSFNGADIGEVGGRDGGAVTHGADGAGGHAAGHGECHCNNGDQSQ